MEISRQVCLITLARSLVTSGVAFGQTYRSVDGETRDSTVASNVIMLTPQPFSMPALYTFGDAGRNTIIGPTALYWDFSTHKSFRIPKEGHVLQFRLEAFDSGLRRGEKCA